MQFHDRKSPVAGVTHHCWWGDADGDAPNASAACRQVQAPYPTNASVTVSAYRFHEEDPLLFAKSLRLVWRNGEDSHCSAAAMPPSAVQPLRHAQAADYFPATVTTYVWYYAFPE